MKPCNTGFTDGFEVAMDIFYLAFLRASEL